MSANSAGATALAALGAASTRNSFVLRVRQAGYYCPRTPFVWQGAQALFLLGTSLASLLIFAVTGHGDVLYGGAVLLALGCLVPIVWLYACKVRRRRQAAQGLPEFVEEYLRAWRMGPGPLEALKIAREQIAGRHPFLAHEVQIVIRVVDLGIPPRLAINDLAARIDSTPKLRDVLATLT